MAPSPHEEYAALMKTHGDGYYLFRPQPYSECHPGAVGYFDNHGTFHKITDISERELPKRDSLSEYSEVLTRTPSREEGWKTRASGSEAAYSFGLDAGLSGALSAAPVEVSAEAKNKWGKTGKAALVSEGPVVNEKFKMFSRGPLGNWVKANAKTLINGPHKKELEEYGLWAISKTWSTQKCKITMESAHDRDTSGGLKVGATGIANGGGSGSSSVKTNSEGWTEYKASPEDKALVISYGGTGFLVTRFRKFFGAGPLKQGETRTWDPDMFTKPILDEEGNKIGIERWRTSRDPETGEISEVKMGEEMIDKEAEAEQKRIDELNEQAEEEETLQASESIGQTEEDDRAEAADEAKYLWDQYQPLMAAIQQIMQVAEENDLRKEEFIKLAKAQQESQ